MDSTLLRYYERELAHLRVVQAQPVVASVVGEHAAGPRVDRHHGAAQVHRLPVQRVVGRLDHVGAPLAAVLAGADVDHRGADVGALADPAR